MRLLFTGAVLGASLVLAYPASAVSGQCSLTDYDTFECNVETDGNGLTFPLPDGRIFSFTLVGENEGVGYLAAEDAAPGQSPQELGNFAPIAEEPGCWISADADTRFCALVFQ